MPQLRFPRMHIAASVQNRILNVLDQLPPIASELPAPNVPDPSELGAQLDQAVTTPPPAIPAPDDSTEAIASAAVQGETAADAVGGLAAIEAL